MEWQTAVIVVFTAVLAAMGITRFAFYQMTQMKALTYEQTFQAMEQVGLFKQDYFESLPKEEVQITSYDGLKLNGMLIPHPSGSNRFVILVHGYTASLPASIPFMDIFREDGFNTLLIDLRRHGKSEGKYTTYGFHEKHDIDSWIRWIRATYGSDSVVGLHGMSLGGGTVLEYLSLPHTDAAFVIADCPYSDLTRLMHHQMQALNRIPAAVFLPLVDRRLFRKAGFTLNQVSPVRSARYSPVPVMFIHGTRDRYIPTEMSEELFAAKEGMKRLLLVEGASHGNALGINPELYKKAVQEFVRDVMEGAVPAMQPEQAEELVEEPVQAGLPQPEFNM
ncbi:alpha/beta hydrolase [Paenibacillus sp. S28]|uniref:alpha/beta hydrolase n=1 Tax=Paenibacillus sp. S28 TaxID=2767463 RepID=UPI00190E4EBB|nr:alpha/beta hydrolase [Paenibacillus sp. S28]MBJ9993086.1 alpha/beta hydrolase [Paenibacillus sp. S28]